MIFVIMNPTRDFLLLPSILLHRKILFRMRPFIKIALAAVLPALPVLASAHAGHSEFPAHHVLHYLATPVHAMPLLMAAVLIVVSAVVIRKELAIRKIRNRRD